MVFLSFFGGGSYFLSLFVFSRVLKLALKKLGLPKIQLCFFCHGFWVLLRSKSTRIANPKLISFLAMGQKDRVPKKPYSYPIQWVTFNLFVVGFPTKKG